MRENLDLLCINLVSMPYVGGNKYNLIEFDKVKTKLMKNMFANKYYPLDCDELLSYTNKIIIGQEVHTWIILKN